MVLQQKLCCSLQLFFRHSGQETLHLPSGSGQSWQEVTVPWRDSRESAGPGWDCGEGEGSGSRVELEDVAVAVFGHPMGSTVALEGVLIPCPLTYPRLGG